jgi:hypothetical protein
MLRVPRVLCEQARQVPRVLRERQVQRVLRE